MIAPVRDAGRPQQRVHRLANRFGAGSARTVGAALPERRQQRRGAKPSVGDDGQRRRELGDELERIDVDAHELAGNRDRMRLGIHLGLAEFGADCEHHIGCARARPAAAPCRGCRRARSGWPGGKMPLPLMVMKTGASSRSAMARTSVAAPCAPPPAITRGRAAPFSSASRLNDQVWPRRRPSRAASRGRAWTSSTSAMITSSGISICTGRGRDEENTANAQARISGSCAGERMVWLKAVTPATRSAATAVRAAAPCRMPSCSRALTLEITSIGTEFGVGLAHGGGDVGHARAGDDEAHAGLAGDAGIAVGHEAGALLVARRDVPDAGRRQAAIELDGMHAGNAEDQLDAIGFEQLHQELAAGRHFPPRNCFPEPGRGPTPGADRNLHAPLHARQHAQHLEQEIGRRSAPCCLTGRRAARLRPGRSRPGSGPRQPRMISSACTVVSPPISGVPVPGAKAGSRLSMSKVR